MNNKSKLLQELEWAVTKVKYSVNPEYDKVAEHLRKAEQLVKLLNLVVH